MEDAIKVSHAPLVFREAIVLPKALTTYFVAACLSCVWRNCPPLICGAYSLASPISHCLFAEWPSW
jgi:hypothetical protein